MAILKDPIESVIQWHDLQISTSEGISISTDFHHPFQIKGARWHLLRTLTGPRLGTELVPFMSREAQLQRNIDATGKIHCMVLSAARDLYSATHYLGGTAVTAPMIWREILLQLFSLSGDEGDEHKWVIPSAVSADSHKELTVRQIIQHFGFFTSDAALEDKILAFFTQRATLALSHVGHL